MKKIILLSLVVIIGILFTAQIKRAFVSMLLLVDSVRPPEKSIMGKLIDGPNVTTVTVPGGGRAVRADLYRPAKKGKHVPLLLVHGVNPTGKDDAQLVLLAKDLARAGFLVMVPDIAGMKTLRLRVSDAEDILESFQYLSRSEDAGSRGGMVGISYGAGPVLLAAADARIRDKVSVVATFGGYYDLRNVLLFILTGAYEYGGQRGYVRPDTLMRWMFFYKNLDLVRSSTDREKLRKIIEKRNQFEVTAADALAKTLGPEGRALYDFLVNTDQDRFSPLYEKLPLTVREQVFRLSPARAMRYITASFIIAHGTDDYAVPFTESKRLADAVEDKGRVQVALLPQFLHIEPIEPSAGDWFKRYVLGGWRLFAAFYSLLAYAE
jgi:dienelactone hydrolase